MSYVLGYIVADGCITKSRQRKNPFSLNITSKDEVHLHKIKTALKSEHKIGKKLNGRGDIAFQFQVRNPVLVKDLMKLGIHPQKTHNLEPISVPKKYFADFTRGFFDGDGSVFIYNVNGTPQIKVGFVCARRIFLEDFNKRLCKALQIPFKTVHCESPSDNRRSNKHTTWFYIDDCGKLMRFMYGDATLYLDRKYKVFQEWQKVRRRKYVKKLYPSKVSWRLNKKVPVSL